MIEINEFESALESALAKSEKLTDKEMAEDISKNCKLKTREILKKFPERNDLIRLKKLCLILSSSDSMEGKSKKIQQNYSDLSPVILKILTEELL